MSHQGGPSLLGRVLLKCPGFYRTLRAPDGRVAQRFDASSVSYMVGEFVALSAVEIALSPHSPARFFLEDVSPVLRDRLVVVDPAGEARRATQAFLKPLVREFGLNFGGDGSLLLAGELPTQLREALKVVLPGLFDFLLGAQHRLQIDIDVRRLSSALSTIRATSRDPGADAYAATFLGVLNTYRPVEAPSLRLVSVASEDQEARFRDLVEDLAYRELSRDAALLGIPEDAKRALRLMKRGLRRLLKRPWLTASAAAGTKTILASTGLEAPNADLAKLLSPAGYLPPIVRMADAYALAEARWREHRRSVAESGYFKAPLQDGFVEQVDAPQPTMEDVQGRPRTTYTFSPQ